MRRAIWLVALLVLLPGLAVGQDMIRYWPPQVAGTSGGGATFTAQVLLPNGSAAAPSLAFASDPGTGIYRFGSGQISWSLVGGEYFRITNAALYWITDLPITLGSLADTSIKRAAPATLQLGVNAATATAQTLKGSDSTGATIAGGSLTLKGGAGTSGIANGGALILSGGDKSSTGEPGAVAIADGGTKPTCAAGIRGSIWYDAGGAGVADTFEVCAKAAAGDVYAWRILATIP